MKSKKYILLSMLASLSVATTVHAQLVADDFALRDGAVLGGSIVGELTQVGGALFSDPTSSSADIFEFGSEGGIAVAKPSFGQGNASSSFALAELQSSGTVRFDAIVNLDQDPFGGNVAGAWIGFTDADENLLNNLQGDHVAMRFIPGNGRIILRSRVDGSFAEIASSGSNALPILVDRDYNLSLEFNFDTLVATATVTDAVTLASTSVSTTISGTMELSRGQFDLTGTGSAVAAADSAYFKNISVIPEPGSYALLGGSLALAVTMASRRK
ncbi:PEP-CTERM sorting domain-containing protein [Coraliomargarita sp. W4R53]